MGRPRLLDLFCGAGGAAVGYHRAGFDVVGVDIEPQPHYPFTFIRADAMTFPLDGYDAIHASPPCQRYSVANNVWKREHPDLIGPTRDLLEASRLPWVIENVPGSPLRTTIELCGLSLGLGVKRHRWFESSVMLWAPPPCPKHHPGDWLLVWGHTVQERGHVVRRGPTGNTTHRRHTTTERGRRAMGIGWMNRDELSQAIPPAYTEYVGAQLLRHLSVFAALSDEGGDDG
jgi:DNA (cytosine-5)-methyltransferase 1